MSKISFSSRAYCKMILHAEKYPHCEVNGLLLAKNTKNESDHVHFVDAIPLFHQCLHVAPMSEVALTLIDQYATANGLVIAGYYMANELLDDLSSDKPAHKIAEKIAENLGKSFLALINNREMRNKLRTRPLRLSQFSDGKWKVLEKDDIIYEASEAVNEALDILTREKRYQELIDFDNHLDDISLDWHNNELNKLIEKTVEAQS